MNAQGSAQIPVRVSASAKQGASKTKKMRPRYTPARVGGIIFSVAFAACLIVLPMVFIFINAFAKGAGVFFESIVQPDVLTALWFSIAVTGISVVLSVLFGVCAAWCIAYFRFPGRRLLISIIDLPVSASPVILGLMFVILYGKYSFVGRYLEAAGLTVIFAFPGLLLTNIAITLPYVARSLIPAMGNLGVHQEEAARLLGARGLQILFRITLPRVKWALLYGIILASARGAGEFGAASVVSGFIRGKTVTLPLQVNIYYSEYLSTQAFVSATLFVLLSAGTLAAKYVVDKKTAAAR